MNHRAKQSPVKELFKSRPYLIAYVFIIIVFFFTLWLNNVNQDADLRAREAQTNRDEKERCLAGIDTRNVDRDQTQRIYSLALGSLPKHINRMTPAQQAQVKVYIKRVTDFRRESFKAIKPSKICAPYVDDDHVTPKQWEKEHPPKQLEDDEPGDKK